MCCHAELSELLVIPTTDYSGGSYILFTALCLSKKLIQEMEMSLFSGFPYIPCKDI